MIIENFNPFVGKHCETTATGSLLNQIGIELSEPMLFGIGESLGYGYFFFKSMSHPFIGGRLKSGEITENICRNLNLELCVKETSSVKQAWKNVKEEISNNKAVGLQLDCYHLDYFANKIHFAGHYISIYGFDDKHAYVNDTEPQGTKAKTTLESLALARKEKGPMSAKNKSYTISKTRLTKKPSEVIKNAIKNNSAAFLNPPIKNLGYKGIFKTSQEIKTWFRKSTDRKRDFQTTAMLMEKAGTGGALFRNLYRDFLQESYDLLGDKTLKQASDEFSEIAKLWTKVSTLFDKAGDTEDVAHINEASEILVWLSDKEKTTMQKLNNTYA